MLRRIGHLLLVAALLAVIGGHWALLQSVAWATMLADNLQRDNVSEAVSKTFDGEHPCALCKHIDEGKRSEKKSDALHLKVQKLEFTSGGIRFHFAAPSEFRFAPDLTPSAEALALAPPVPPPRAAVS